MATFIGQSGNLVLFSDDENAVVVNTSVSVVVASGAKSALEASRVWADGEFSEYDEEAAATALSSISRKVAENDSRLYTIPVGVKKAASLGLESYSTNDKGVTPGAVTAAQRLLAQDQVSLHELSYLHQRLSSVDTASTQGLLFGGASGSKWASAIIDTHGAVLASAGDLDSFEDLITADPDASPEFIARLYLDGSGIDRLYRVDLDMQTYAWDGSSWTNFGLEDASIWAIDGYLDGSDGGPASAEVTHVLIDPESAINIAGWLGGKPFAKVTVDDIDTHEAQLVRLALEDPESDWETIDRTLTAAGAQGDGVYTPEERSANASVQVRDGKGLFAKTGARVQVNGNSSMTGKISRIDSATKTVEVALESGGTITVPAASTETISEYTPTQAGVQPEIPRVDFSGILAEPRTPINRTLGQIPNTLPRLDAKSLTALVNNFPAWVKSQRMEPSANTLGKHPLLNGWTPSGIREQDKKTVTAAGATATVGQPVTPTTSDVQPVYLALVADDDPRAVLKLTSLVPAGTQSTAPMAYSREIGEWIRDDHMITALTSMTPPPVVALDAEMLNDVLRQVDDSQGVETEENSTPTMVDESGDPITAGADPLMVLWGPRKDFMEAALTAAGGLDRNRGGADKLRRYWTSGKGAAKIRWGTPGDWTRCVRNLGKYMGPRARGYCALRHKEVTGMWTGDRKHRQDFSVVAAGKIASTSLIVPEAQVVRRSALTAAANVARARVQGQNVDKYAEIDRRDMDALVASTGMVVAEGGKFFIPLALPEGIESGDGRMLVRGTADIRTLPISLLWQIHTDDGHKGAVVVGRIERLGRTPKGIGGGYGTFDTGFYGREAERMVRNGMLRFVSADMDLFEAQELAADDDVEGRIGGKKIVVDKARVMAVTIVAKPAFQEATIQIVPETVIEEETVIPDGIYVEGNDPYEEASLVAAGYVSDAIPVVPPAQWFKSPGLSGPTPLTIEDDGRVFGHIASWDTAHLNPALNGVKPPRSRTNYGYFRTGLVRTDDGSDIAVGQLTLAGGHAGMQASAREAVKHYDDTASSFADVAAGEDEHGIWVAGALRPGTSAEQIRQARASAPSGDWRAIRGSLELVAVCQVNVPGFPIARSMVASGYTTAMVAAGAMPLARMKGDPVAELAERLERLEGARDQELALRASALRERMRPSLEKRDSELAARAESLFDRVAQFGVISAEGRKKAADKGEALPDGSFPIRNEADLKKAIQAFGRAGNKAAAKKHITKRAKALGKTDILPENWSTASADAVTASVASFRERIQSLQASATRGEERELREELERKGIVVGDEPAYTPDTQPRNSDGRFRNVLARLRDDLGVSGNQAVLTKLRETQDYDGVGDYTKAARSALDLMDMIDRMDSGALNPEAISNVRNTTQALSEAIANIPLPFENQATKIRYSDLPPALRDLIDEMINRVETKYEGSEDADEALNAVRSFKSGSDVFAQSEVNEHMNRLLRLLN